MNELLYLTFFSDCQPKHLLATKKKKHKKKKKKSDAWQPKRIRWAFQQRKKKKEKVKVKNKK